MLKTIMGRSAIIAFACSLSLSAHAMADDVKRPIRIPSGDLATALQLLAKQSGSDLVFRPDQVQKFSTGGVEGELSVEEAVTKLLEGTPLTVSTDSTGAKLIALPAAPAPSEAPRDFTNTSGRIGTSTSRVHLAQAEPSAPAKRASEDRGAAAEKAGKPLPLQEYQPDLTGVPEVLVFGSKALNMDITRTEDDPQPYVVFDREKIQQSGAANIEAFLRDRLPMNANGLASGQRVSQSGAQSLINLRGLGSGQTLILINGRRTTPGPAGGGSPRQPDINGIPMSAIDRIEVLPATASGIYGGSATGGVINIILRQDYTGAEVKATYGNTFRSDVAKRRVDLSTGFNLGDKTNVLLAASYADENPLNLRERPELVERYYDTVRANAPGVLLPPNNPPLGELPNIRSADGSNLVFRDGTPLGSPVTSIPSGYAGTAADGGRSLLANAGSYNLGIADSLQHVTGGSTQIAATPRNAAVRATLQREFSSRIRAFLETTASDTHTAGPPPYTNGALLGPYLISASAPNNPFTRDILVTVPVGGLIGFAETDMTQTRATGGVIFALPAEWKGEADYTWARTRVRQGGSQAVSAGADTAAIRSGQLDILRDTRAYPVDLSAYLTSSPFRALNEITFQDAALRFAGPTLELPAGPLYLSTVMEYRDEDFAAASAVSPGLSLFYPERSARATSLYVETRVPLISAKNPLPAVEALELQLSARGDEYRTRGQTGFVMTGSNTPIVSADNTTRSINPTVAIRYQPVEDLVIRASYGTGFVAPDVSQLAPSIFPGTLTIFDPRRGNTSTTLQIGQSIYQGNPELDPEESKSGSVGFILTPRFAPGLRLSLDYLRIRKTDNIATYPGGNQALIDDEALFPERVRRGGNLPGDPAGWAGPITFLDATLFNIASAEVEAFDLQLDYSLATDFGTFGFSSVATRQTHYRTRARPGQPELENVGLSYLNPQGFTGNAEVRWQHRGWTVGWLARYFDSYVTANPALLTNVAHVTLQGNGGRVPSQAYHDLNASFSPDLSGQSVPGFLEGTEFSLGIRNVFDKTPPFDAYVYNLFRTFHSPLGEPLGTTYQMTITKRF